MQLQNQSSNQFETVDSSNISDEEESLKDETLKVIQTDSRFGVDYFSKAPTTITPTQDLSVPGDYKISLKDKLSILLSGAKDARYNVSVNLDGTIQIPEIGALNVVGLELDEINNLLKNLVEEIYSGVNADVTISGLSAKKITIVGAVEVPGTYLVNPFTTISNVLAYSGGIKEYGSIRNIEVIKPNGEKYSFDLYDLLIFGDRTNDKTLDAGDTVLVNGTSNFVDINGEVIRPGLYEYKQDESVDDLLKYALGLKGVGTTKVAAQKVNPSNLTLETFEVDLGQSVSAEGTCNCFCYGRHKAGHLSFRTITKFRIFPI